MKKLVLLAMVASISVVALVAPVASAAVQDAHKWYVCKYVGPPGSGEVLQTGNNPIFVDENSIDTSPVFIGATFSDKQSHSLVVAGPFIEPLEVEPTCPGETPPEGEATALLSTPTCQDLTIVASGINLTDEEQTFSVFINNVLIDNFVVGAGQTLSGPALAVVNGDVVKVTLLNSETVLVTKTVALDCAVGGGGGGGTPPPCPGKIVVSDWYGDPRVNVTLTGKAVFIVKGGIQRTTGIRTLNKTLACNESFRFGRYKVKHGHFLSIYMDGVLIVHVKPPRIS